MRDFGQHYRTIRFKIANGLCTDEDAITSFMDYCRYSRETATKALSGMKRGIEKDRLKREGKDMRTKSNRAKKASEELTVEQIVKNYSERGRLLKSEIELLINSALAGDKMVSAAIANAAASPLDKFIYPKEDVFENFDNEQIVTLGVGIGTWMLMLLNKNLPEHSMLARKDRIGDVQHAIMTLSHGLGKPLSQKALDYWCAVWNLTWNMAMKKIRDDREIADKAEYYIEGEHGQNKANS